MSKLVLAAGAALLVAVLSGQPAQAAPAETAAEIAAVQGSITALTYNIAGLPEPISGSDPATNTPLIGARLGGYDIVNVQEDFNYHAALYAADNHPHRTPTSGGVPFGDGLNTLADYPYSDLVRVRWAACNGTDCLTPKGFTLKRIRLAEGVYLDLYNAHANAGSTAADLTARRANIGQLSQYITANSAGNAVLLMGDLNTRYTRTGDNVRLLREANGLTDAWVSLVRGGVEPAAGSPDLVCDPASVTDACEVVDKIFYRGGPLLRLTATGYANEHARFLDGAGRPLSDHYPLRVDLAWQVAPDLRASDLFGGPHGSWFTDAPLVRGTTPAAYQIRAGSRLDQVAVRLSGGPTLVHGGTGGTARELVLRSGEYVTEVRLSAGQRSGRTRIFHLELRTNLGAVLAGGTPTGDTVTYRTPAGWRLAGFQGRSGDEVDKLGLIYTPLP
nr:jacalin-like lectin [Micromonospora sp. DSM 115978]